MIKQQWSCLLAVTLPLHVSWSMVKCTDIFFLKCAMKDGSISLHCFQVLSSGHRETYSNSAATADWAQMSCYFYIMTFVYHFTFK